MVTLQVTKRQEQVYLDRLYIFVEYELLGEAKG